MKSLLGVRKLLESLGLVKAIACCQLICTMRCIGVSEKAAYEAEARKVKKDAAAAAAAAKALATAGTTNIADVDPEAVQP